MSLLALFAALAAPAAAQLRAAPLPAAPLSLPALPAAPLQVQAPSAEPAWSLAPLEASPALRAAPGLRTAPLALRERILPFRVLNPGSLRTAPARLRRAFDGSALRGLNAEADGPEERELELRFLAAQAKSLVDSQRYATVRLIRNTQGSRRYWGRFKRGAEVQVLSKGQRIMTSRVTRGVTRAIGKLTKDDLQGVFTPRELAELPVKRLREALIQNLSEFRSSSAEAPVSLKTKVRLVQFQPFSQSRREDEPEPLAPKPRRPLSLSPGSPLWRMSQTLPKVVVLDLDGFEEPVSSELLEDVSKLQRAGVMFLGVSRRPLFGPGGAGETLFKNMSSYQRNSLLSYRFTGVFEGGGAIVNFGRFGRVSSVEGPALTALDRDGLRHAARKALSAAGRSARKLDETSYQPAYGEFAPRSVFEFRVPRGADAGALSLAFQTELRSLGLRFEVTLRQDGRESFLRASKASLPASIPAALQSLKDRHGVYVLGGEIAALTEDKALLAALPGAPDLSKLSGGLRGVELAENALGAMLGEYRENLPGDLTGSASRMSSYLGHFQEYLERYVLQLEEALQSIYFFSGHMVHKSLDWAVHELRQGRTPDENEVADKMLGYWDEEARTVEKPLALPPGHTVAGMRAASRERTIVMYRHVLDLAREGYVMLGTELPNFFGLRTFDRAGDLKRRYILHTIFDLVALRPLSEDTAELVVFDFKSGPAQTRHKLARDLQVLTYSLFLRYKWSEMPAPYEIVGGRTYRIVKSRVEFLYSPVRVDPPVNPWDLARVEHQITRTLDRMEKEAAKTVPEPRKAPKERGRKKK